MYQVFNPYGRKKKPADQQMVQPVYLNVTMYVSISFAPLLIAANHLPYAGSYDCADEGTYNKYPNASPPWNTAGAILRAGFTEVPV